MTTFIHIEATTATKERLKIIIMKNETRNHETSKVMRGMRELGIDVRAVNVNNGSTRNCNRIRYNGKDWTWGAFYKAFVAR